MLLGVVKRLVVEETVTAGKGMRVEQPFLNLLSLIPFGVLFLTVGTLFS